MRSAACRGALAISVAPPRPADRDNAVFVYQRAFEAMGRTANGDDRANGTWEWDKAWWKAWNAHLVARADESGKVDFDLHDPQLHRFLARQAPRSRSCGKRLRCPVTTSSTTIPGSIWPRSSPRSSRYLRQPACWRLDALGSAAEGNNRQAIDDINALFLLAHHVAGDNALVTMLVAVSMDGTAVSALQAVLACDRVAGEDLATVRIPDAGRLHAVLKRASV